MGPRPGDRGAAAPPPPPYWAFALWVAAVLGGFGTLWAYGSRAGPDPGPPAHWPAPGGLALDPTAPTLLVFVHPRCPCTRASLRNLERLAARWAPRPSVDVLLFVPAGLAPAEAAEFADADLQHQLERIPGARIHLDDGGHVAQRFGALTSGDTLVYGPDGELRFAGGLTSARGHEGLGRSADDLRRALAGPVPRVLRPPTFGCPLAEHRPAPDLLPREHSTP